MRSPSGSDGFQDYMDSSYGGYPYNGGGEAKTKMIPMQGGMASPGNEMGTRGMAPPKAGLGALQPQKAPTQMTPAVQGQVGPNPMKPMSGVMGGGMMNQLAPMSGVGQGGPVQSAAIPASSIQPRPPIQNPIRRPELGMGAVERGFGFGGLDGITPQTQPAP